jgi:hypothetical protein
MTVVANVSDHLLSLWACSHFIFACSSKSTAVFFAASGVEHEQHNQDQFRFHRASFCSSLKSVTSLTRSQSYVSTLTSMTLLYLQAHILTPATHKLLTYSLPSQDRCRMTVGMVGCGPKVFQGRSGRQRTGAVFQYKWTENETAQGANNGLRGKQQLSYKRMITKSKCTSTV